MRIHQVHHIKSDLLRGYRLTGLSPNWRHMVRDRLQALAWDQVVADVWPFLQPGADLDLLALENVMWVL